MHDILVTVIVLVAAAAALRRPWIGVLVCAWLEYMNPHRLCYGFAYSFPFFVIAASATIIGTILSREPKSIPWCREIGVLLLFILWMNVTVHFALNPDGAWTAWNQHMKTQLMVFTGLMLMTSRGRIDSFIWVIVLSLGFYGVKGGLFALATGGNYRVFGPADSFIEDNNALAFLLTAILPLMRYLQTQSKKRWVRLGLTFAMILTTLAVLSSYSRAGLLALGTVGLLMWLKTRKKLILAAAMAVCVPLYITFLPSQWFRRMQTIENYQKDASAEGRINAWRFAYNLAKDRPIVGGGFRVFTPALFFTYAPHPRDYHEAHSIYFQTLAEQGFPGLCLFLTLGILVWRSASWVIRRVKHGTEQQWAGELAAMVQVALAGYAVGGTFAGGAYYEFPYHLLTIIVVLKLLAKTTSLHGVTGNYKNETAPQFC